MQSAIAQKWNNSNNLLKVLLKDEKGIQLQNTGAVAFWEKVIDRYAKSCFQKELKTISEPKPHPMIVMKFNAKKERA